MDSEKLKEVQENAEYLDTFNGTRVFLNSYNNFINGLTEEELKLPEVKALDKFYKKANKNQKSMITKMDKVLKDMDYLEKVRVTYFNKPCQKLAAIVPDYKVYLSLYILNPTGDMSFFNWEDKDIKQVARDNNGNFKHAMTRDEGMQVYDNLMKGTLRHGQKFGDFTVMGVYNDAVRISCGLYSKEMILSVGEEILKEDEE